LLGWRMLETLHPEYNCVVIHYGEITLKRSRRGKFERILRENLEEHVGVDVRRLQGRLVIDLEPGMDVAGLLERIGKVFGVVWYAPAVKVSSLEEARDILLRILSRTGARSMKIMVKRSDKRFPKTSIEVARELGREVSEKLGLRVDLKNPEQTIIIEITEDGIYVSLIKLRGPGGLPLNASGRVLGLYSGGAGSALACWFMMKRGCRVDLLHVHDEESGEKLLRSEIMYNVEKLLEYALRMRIYMIPLKPILGMFEDYQGDEKSTVKAAFILRLGEEVAKLKGYPGLVLGSRLENLNVLEGLLEMLSMRSLPVHMPLIAFTGEEVAKRCSMLGFRVTQDLREHKRYPAIPDPAELWRKLEAPVKRALEGLETYDLRLGIEPKRVS